MIASIWNFWPWISLLIFFMLVKWLFGITRGQMYVPGFEMQSPNRRTSDGIAFLLFLALIVGAAICVLIDYYM